ncbi:hypothetical protein KP509_07G080400 [Ceratopteris richardii]|nr:hypothetical protein KP509_07G080400 [Ceratopteris richardii]
MQALRLFHLEEMNSSTIHRTNTNPASQLLISANIIPNFGLGSARSPFFGDLSSHSHLSGNLTCCLYKQVKGYSNISHEGYTCHWTINCIHDVKEVKQSTYSQQRIPPVFPINVSSHLKGWISQLFHPFEITSDTYPQEKATIRSQSNQLNSYLVDIEVKKGLDPVQKYILHPFTHAESASPCEKKEEASIDPKALAEVVIHDLLSAIPSINALRNIPYFDMLQSSIIQDPSSHASFVNGMTSLDCIEEVQNRISHSRQLITANELGSSDGLASWLSIRLPSGVSQWGSAPGTKPVINLWMELKEGEIVLEDSCPPRRIVHVASVKIRNKAGHMLVEAHQEMADGTIRLRNRPLSEKMKPGENVEEACFRGIFEELGSQLGARSRVRILLGSYSRKEEERESLSYPGLLTSYVIHSVDAIVDNLPETGFCTEEDELMYYNCSGSGVLPSEGSESFSGEVTVGVRKHFWRWVPQPS